ncbi:MAG: hypothetical protein AAFZ63_20075 [Bacteroidota bacterium]
MQKFISKLRASGQRLGQILRWLPIRLRRLGKHLRQFCWTSAMWWLEAIYLLLDVVGLPEIYETLVDWVKWNSRALYPEEVELLIPIFGNTIHYDRVRIDEHAFIGPPQMKICYVSFYTINAWGGMSPALLIHEMVHVWQFQHWGSVYIPRALRAQASPEGYNYGGAPAVVNWARQDARLEDFNPEQQADLVADYWRLLNGWRTQWGPAGPADIPYYGYFVDQLQSAYRS